MNFKYKRNLIFLFSLVLVLFIVISNYNKKTYAINENDQDIKRMESLGQELRNAKDSNSMLRIADEEVALVNDKPILKAKFDNLVFSTKYTQSKKSKKELLDAMIDDELLLQEAEKLGICESDEEIENDINEIVSIYKTDSVQREIIDAYINGLDISFDEFLDNNRRGMLRHKTINKLRKQVLGESTLNVNQDWRNDPKWVEFKDTLRKRANIIIYDKYLE